MSFDDERRTVAGHIAQWAEENNVQGLPEFYEVIDEAARRIISLNADNPKVGSVGKAIQLCLIGLTSSVAVFFADRIVPEQQDDFMDKFIKTFAEGLTATAKPMLEAVREKEKTDGRDQNEGSGRLH